MFGNLISIFARHRNAANLLMAILIIAGAFSMSKLNRQLMPDIAMDMILVSVAWPGASPEDVAANIVEAVEIEVRFMDGVDQVSAIATEGAALVYIEYEQGHDMSKALTDTQAAIGRIITLPEDSEKPVISLVERYDPVSKLLISGPFPEESLTKIARSIRDDLLNSGLAKVDLMGVREPEIWVEIPEARLRALGLSIEDVSRAIGLSSLNLPSGNLEGRISRQIRSNGLAESAADVGNIEIISRTNGAKVYLRDIANITETYDDEMPTLFHNGNPAIQLDIKRQKQDDSITSARIIKDYITTARKTLPASITMVQYDIIANLVSERISLLTKNGIGGLMIVVSILYLFLNVRLAFWVAMGIPISIMGAMGIMLITGQSINVISMIGLLMALGIIVDDAIVVGEHTASRYEQGYSLQDAIEIGSHRMLAPVFAASLTTISAFAPLLLVKDFIGQIIEPLPIAVMIVIVVSLIECFLILPGHLRHGLGGPKAKEPGFKVRFNERFQHFRNNRFRQWVENAYNRRYVTLCAAIAMLILSGAFLGGGYVGFNFLPGAEQSIIQGNVIFATGSERAKTEQMLEELSRAAIAAETKLTNGEQKLIRVGVAHVGETITRSATDRLTGDHVGSYRLELIPSEERDIRNNVFLNAWNEEIREMPGLDKLVLEDPSRIGSPNTDIDIRLRGSDNNVVKKAALEVQELIARFDGAESIEDDLPYGKEEMALKLTARGHAMGMTTTSVARQVRNAFEGAIAKRFPRQEDEVLVRVMLPEEERTASRLQSLMLRTPTGQEIPLPEVVDIIEQPGFARIRRQDGRKEVSVKANVDNTVSTAGVIIAALPEAGLDAITEKYNIDYTFRGRAEEQANAFSDFRIGLIVALSAIYIILAWVFASYTRPIVVMAVIPFGLIGAVFGHFIMDFNLSILSVFSLLGLTGILVNDSIILVTTIDDHIKNGQKLKEAIINGTVSRLRPVLITSLTTIGGLCPLMFERSTQAQFLIPVAITIVFGLATATFLVLLVIPALLGIIDDIQQWDRRRLGKDQTEKTSEQPAESS